MFLQNIRKQTIFYEQSIIIVSIKTEQGGPMKKGYIQVYTGDGKGKTTAAVGLAIRAAGAGQKVCIIQFMKSLAYSEQKVLQTIPGITLITVGKPYFIAKEGMLTEEQLKTWGRDVVIYPAGHPPEEYKKMIDGGIQKAVDALQSGRYGVVILDEYNMACWYDLADDADTEKILHARRPETELVITGRNAPEKILDAADLITEMKKIRHYFDQGVTGRKGIED